MGPGRESAFSYKTAASGEAMAISSVNVGIIPSDLSGKPIPLSVKMGLPLGVCCYSVALCVPFFAAPSTAARQASLSFAISQNLLTLMFIELVMPSSNLILCRPLQLLPPIPSSIRVFSNESTLRMRWPMYCSFRFSIIASNEIPGLISLGFCKLGRGLVGRPR